MDFKEDDPRKNPIHVHLADSFTRPYVDQDFARELIAALDALIRVAERVYATPPPPVPGTGFRLDRRSGVLYGSIPALGIKGPAILLAPEAVACWANGFHGLHQITDHIDAEGMRVWFGVHGVDHWAAAVGLVNVVQHELTHAMVALPNDPVGDVEELFRQRWKFYDRAPGLEEGLCDVTAAIATRVTLLKAEFGLSGRKIPRLHRGRYAEPWDRIFPAITETYADYCGAETDTWLRAWENNNRDFGAFSGLVKLYATDFGGIDWDQTFQEFRAGRISTGK